MGTPATAAAAAVVKRESVSAFLHLPHLGYSQMARGVKLATSQSQTLVTSLQAAAAFLIDW